MKVLIQDATTLREIGPNELAAYLRSHSWKQVEQIGKNATVWTADEGGQGTYEILLPLDATRHNFAMHMSEALQTLEIAERRSQLEILHDILVTTADVLRFRLVHGRIAQGTLPLEYGMQMVQGAWALLLAAACASVSSHATYATPEPPEAMRYMSGLRMGQTETDSFVLIIHSPVTPRTQLGLFAATPDAPWDEPFERRVLLTLTDALSTLQQIVTVKGKLKDHQLLVNAVRFGVSANLCDALLTLSIDSTAEEIDLQISWSPSRLASDKLSTRFYFPRDTFPLLQDAASLLRGSLEQELEQEPDPFED